MPRTEQLAPVCFIDIETDDLARETRQAWEIALIEANGTEHEWQLPIDLSTSNPMSLGMNGFHGRRRPPDMLTPLRDFAREFVRLTLGKHIVGAVPSFDEETLWKLLRANGECPMWHYHLVDVEALAAGYLATGVAPKAWANVDYGTEPIYRPPWNSTLLSYAVGVDPEQFERHSAIGDTRWAKAIYEAVMG